LSPPTGIGVLVLAAALVAGCSKPPEPKADAAKERQEAMDRAKQGPLGTQVQAVETAKGLGEDLDKKAREAVEKAEQGAK